jgi:hypothetical protein
LATFWINALSGSVSPALLNAAALGTRRSAVSLEDPRDQRFSRPSDISHAAPFSSLSGAGERRKQATPAAFAAVEDAAHLVATRP